MTVWRVSLGVGFDSIRFDSISWIGSVCVSTLVAVPSRRFAQAVATMVFPLFSARRSSRRTCLLALVLFYSIRRDTISLRAIPKCTASTTYRLSRIHRAHGMESRCHCGQQCTVHRIAYNQSASHSQSKRNETTRYTNNKPQPTSNKRCVALRSTRLGASCWSRNQTQLHTHRRCVDSIRVESSSRMFE